MSVLRVIAEWFKYQRLEHYPSLAAFDRDAALKRLEAYEQEEREACKYWLRSAWAFVIASAVVGFALAYRDPLARGWLFLTQIPSWGVQYALHRRIRRRVDAKVMAELGEGRSWTCFECGYDLRESPERCPECGAAVRVRPPE